MEVVLLQLGDQFLLVVQLVSQAADLLLVSLAVGVDLLLHRFLNAEIHKMCINLTELFKKNTETDKK